MMLNNSKNEDMMKDVPYFCYSHLVGKFIISNKDYIAIESYQFNNNVIKNIKITWLI